VDQVSTGLDIDRQIDKQGEYSPVKSGRKGEREIPLPDELVKALRKHKLASRYSAYDDFVFVTTNGTAHNHGNIAQRVLRRTIKKAKIADPAPSMHDFRHTFASAWIAAGVGSVVELSKHLGHADPSITMKRYSHEFEKAERGEALREGLGNLYGPSLAAALATDD
jgi:integrase